MAISNWLKAQTQTWHWVTYYEIGWWFNDDDDDDEDDDDVRIVLFTKIKVLTLSLSLTQLATALRSPSLAGLTRNDA